MAYAPGQWVNVIQNSVLQPSATPNVNLGRPFDYLQVFIPLINTGNLTLEVSDTALNTDYYPLGKNMVISSTLGNYHDYWHLGGHQFFRITQSTVQNTNVTWRFRAIAA